MNIFKTKKIEITDTVKEIEAIKTWVVRWDSYNSS